MNHYLVIGRIIGDDEDTPAQFMAENADSAYAQFVELMQEMDGAAASDDVVVNHIFKCPGTLSIDYSREMLASPF